MDEIKKDTLHTKKDLAAILKVHVKGDYTRIKQYSLIWNPVENLHTDFKRSQKEGPFLYKKVFSNGKEIIFTEKLADDNNSKLAVAMGDETISTFNEEIGIRLAKKNLPATSAVKGIVTEKILESLMSLRGRQPRRIEALREILQGEKDLLQEDIEKNGLYVPYSHKRDNGVEFIKAVNSTTGEIGIAVILDKKRDKTIYAINTEISERSGTKSPDRLEGYISFPMVRETVGNLVRQGAGNADKSDVSREVEKLQKEIRDYFKEHRNDPPFKVQSKNSINLEIISQLYRNRPYIKETSLFSFVQVIQERTGLLAGEKIEEVRNNTTSLKNILWRSPVMGR